MFAEDRSGRRSVALLVCLSLSSGFALGQEAPVHRFWSDLYGGHFFTVSEDERDYIVRELPEWTYEGTDWAALLYERREAAPVFRFWSDELQGHFYTIVPEERDYAESLPEWQYEQVAFHAYPAPFAHTEPVYRFWSDAYRSHFFTAVLAEKEMVEQQYEDWEWRYEQIAWYSPLPSEPGESEADWMELELPSHIYQAIDYPNDNDVFELSIDAESILTLESTGTTDTKGWLWDADFNLINDSAEDDDRGPDLNFRIEERVPPGSYFLSVSHYHSDEVGLYGLVARAQATTVREPPPDTSTETEQEQQQTDADAVDDYGTVPHCGRCEVSVDCESSYQCLDYAANSRYRCRYGSSDRCGDVDASRTQDPYGNNYDGYNGYDAYDYYDDRSYLNDDEGSYY